jgi:hypothetical protein
MWLSERNPTARSSSHLDRPGRYRAEIAMGLNQPTKHAIKSLFRNVVNSVLQQTKQLHRPSSPCRRIAFCCIGVATLQEPVKVRRAAAAPLCIADKRCIRVSSRCANRVKSSFHITDVQAAWLQRIAFTAF